MDKIIEVTKLKKSYGKVRAVREISFYVERGKLFAFLGPNGAGKSTTIDMLCTFLKPDAGDVIVNGHVLGKEDDEIRRSIGVVFQDGLLDALLSVKENMQVRGSFYGKSGKELENAIDHAASAAGIKDILGRPYGKLSGGQRRRADIARALVNTPKILFLDEPTTGLDPQTRKSVWTTIKDLQQKTDMTVFMTTHYMEEAADADYVIIIDKGIISARGTPSELRQKHAGDSLKLYGIDIALLEEKLNQQGYEYTRKVDEIILKLEKTLDALPIIEVCRDYINGFEVYNGTLDDAFIAVTGRDISEHI